VEADRENAEFCTLVANTPIRDRSYACQVMATDQDLVWAQNRYGAHDAVAALSCLTSKLLIHAARTGAVPIVGKSYAWSLLASKTRNAHAVSAPAALLGSDRQQVAYAAFAAGLSLGFLKPGTLGPLPFGRLQRFKSDHAKLLERHQLHLLEVTQAFRGIPDGPEFAEQVAALRASASKKRLDLDQEATDAWRSAFTDVGTHGIAAAAGAAIPALTVLWTGSMAHIASAALPSALAALGVVTTGVVKAVSKIGKANSSNAMAYLFEARKSLVTDG
jgi:hypothetical protein